MNKNEKELIQQEANNYASKPPLPYHNEIPREYSLELENIAYKAGAEYGYNLAKSTGIRWVKASERVPDTTYPVYVRFDGFKNIAYFENKKWVYFANHEPINPAFTRNVEWLYEPERT